MADPTPPAGTHNDGGVVFGSQVITIDSKPYVAYDIDVQFPVKEIVRENEVGVEDADVLIEGPFTGTATLQVKDGATPVPPVGSAFTIASLNGAVLKCKIKEPGVKFGKDAETQISISFKKRHAAE